MVLFGKVSGIFCHLWEYFMCNTRSLHFCTATAGTCYVIAHSKHKIVHVKSLDYCPGPHLNIYCAHGWWAANFINLYSNKTGAISSLGKQRVFRYRPEKSYYKYRLYSGPGSFHRSEIITLSLRF